MSGHTAELMPKFPEIQLYKLENEFKYSRVHFRANFPDKAGMKKLNFGV